MDEGAGGLAGCMGDAVAIELLVAASEPDRVRMQGAARGSGTREIAEGPRLRGYGYFSGAGEHVVHKGRS